jgi:hypothetical protein
LDGHILKAVDPSPELAAAVPCGRLDDQQLAAITPVAIAIHDHGYHGPNLAGRSLRYVEERKQFVCRDPFKPFRNVV